MSEVTKVSDWRSLVEYSSEGPRHHVLADTDSYRAVLVGIEAGGTIPPHPSTDATYHFLGGTGWMIIDGERFPVSAGTTMVVPAGAQRGVEAETRLAFLGSHGGHKGKDGNNHSHASTVEHKSEVAERIPAARRPMLMLGLMTAFMLVVMFGLWQIGASPLAAMLSSMGTGVLGAMVLPMLGLVGMFVVMFFMYRTMARMSGGMGGHDHAMMMGKNSETSAPSAAGQEVTYTIPAISCGGCKQTIETKLAALEGVSSVAVDVGTRQAVIRYDAPTTREAVESRLVEIGYPAKAEG